MKRLLALALLLPAAPAFAQRTEVAVMGGYTTSGDIDKTALGIQELNVDGSFTWGVTAGHFFSDHMGAEVSWSRQDSGLVIGTPAGSAELFDVKVGLLQGSFVYQLGGEHARWRPFFLAGLGATFLSGDDLESETKLSWGLGAGLKWLPSSRLGARLQARWTPTRLNDTSSDFCDPFGFCQGTLQQFELMGGITLRF